MYIYMYIYICIGIHTRTNRHLNEYNRNNIYIIHIHIVIFAIFVYIYRYMSTCKGGHTQKAVLGGAGQDRGGGAHASACACHQPDTKKEAVDTWGLRVRVPK